MANNDVYVETTRTGWFARMKNALGGIIAGPVCIILGIGLLTWNEGRSARAIEALREGQREVISVASTDVDPTLNGKLLYLTGPVATTEPLVDPLFGVTQSALVLRRDAEMYQWREEKDSKSEKHMGGGETTSTTYSYAKVWSRDLIRSSNFKRPEGHQNPSTLRVASFTFVARDARIGSFWINQELLRKLDGQEPVVVAEHHRASSFPDARVVDGGFYIGGDPNSPSIGDSRVKFSAVNPRVVSVVGAQIGQGIGPYVASNGYTIALARSGAHSPDSLFRSALNENSLITWLVRFAGLLALFLGFAAPMKILSVIGDVVPFIGSLIGLGTGFVAFVLSLVTWTLTIAIAWFAYRPLAALTLVVSTGALVLWLCRRRSRKSTRVGGFRKPVVGS